MDPIYICHENGDVTLEYPEDGPTERIVPVLPLPADECPACLGAEDVGRSTSVARIDRSTLLLAAWATCHATATFLALLLFAGVAEAHRLGDGGALPHSHGEVEIVGFGLLFIALAAIEVARAAWARSQGMRGSPPMGPSIPDLSDL